MMGVDQRLKILSLVSRVVALVKRGDSRILLRRLLLWFRYFFGKVIAWLDFQLGLFLVVTRIFVCK